LPVNYLIVYEKSLEDDEFVELYRLDAPSSVEDIINTASDNIAVAFRDGSVHLYVMFPPNGEDIELEHVFESKSCCNAVAFTGGHVFVGHENGTVDVIQRSKQEKLESKLIMKNLAGVMDICGISEVSVACAQLNGSIVIVDAREDVPPEHITLVTNAGITALDSHPVFSGVIAYGTGDGRIGFYDLLTHKRSVLFSVGSGPVWQVKFDPKKECILYTSCDDGSFLQIDVSGTGRIASNAPDGSTDLFVSANLHSRIFMNHLIAANSPVNGFDIFDGLYVAGMENNQIEVISVTQH